MEDSSSYRLGDFADIESELARLDAQAAVIWPKEAGALRRQGLSPAARVLELGCGPGFVTERLLELLPEGSVTAVDLDPEMVALARARLREHERVEVAEASATALPFADGSFDAVVARLVLEHVPDRDAALRELRRILRTGGRLFVIEIDDGWPMLLDPEPSFAAELEAAVAAMIKGRGADRNLGRRLPQLFAGAAFTDVAFEVVTLHTAVDDATALDEMTNPEPFLEQLEQAGLLAPDTLAEAREYFAAYERGEVHVESLLAVFIGSAAA